MAYYEFPHTENYDSDLNFLIEQYESIITKISEIEEEIKNIEISGGVDIVDNLNSTKVNSALSANMGRELNALKADKTELTAKATELKALIDTKANKADIPDVTTLATKEELNTDIEEVKALIPDTSTFATKVDLLTTEETLEETIDTKANKTDLESIKTSIDGKVDNTTYNTDKVTLEKSISDNSANIAINTTSIENLKTSIDTMDTSFKQELENKQGKLTAGANITITEDNVISSTGGSGGSTDIINSLTSERTDAALSANMGKELNDIKANKTDLSTYATKEELDNKANKTDLTNYETVESAEDNYLKLSLNIDDKVDKITAEYTYATINDLKTKQDKLTAGTNITISDDNVISASGGGGSVDIVDNLTSTDTTKALSANMGRELQDTKQDLLVSGTNIKRINGTSLIGSGSLNLNTYNKYSYNQEIKDGALTDSAASFTTYMLTNPNPAQISSFTFTDENGNSETLSANCYATAIQSKGYTINSNILPSIILLNVKGDKLIYVGTKVSETDDTKYIFVVRFISISDLTSISNKMSNLDNTSFQAVLGRPTIIDSNGNERTDIKQSENTDNITSLYRLKLGGLYLYFYNVSVNISWTNPNNVTISEDAPIYVSLPTYNGNNVTPYGKYISGLCIRPGSIGWTNVGCEFDNTVGNTAKSPVLKFYPVNAITTAGQVAAKFSYVGISAK